MNVCNSYKMKISVSLLLSILIKRIVNSILQQSGKFTLDPSMAYKVATKTKAGTSKSFSDKLLLNLSQTLCAIFSYFPFLFST